MNGLSLAIELTTHTHCSVALSGRVDGSEIDAQLVHETTHPVKPLLELCDRLLDENKHLITFIDTVVIASGPGMFTGLRIAEGIASAFSLTHNCFFLGIPTLELLAYSSNYSGNRIIALDARRDECYIAGYTGPNSRIKILHTPQLMSISQLSELSISYPELLVGNLPEDITQGLPFTHKKLCLPYAADMARYSRIVDSTRYQSNGLEYLRSGL